MPDSREEVLKYLADLHLYWGRYHNHKETSAWAGLVFSVALLGQFLILIGGGVARTCTMRIAAVLVVLAFALLAVAYVRQQFSLRRWAADVSAASFALRSEIISNPAAPIDVSRFGLPAAGDEVVQASHVLPNELLVRAATLRARGQGAVRRLETVAYVILGGAAVLAILKIGLEP